MIQLELPLTPPNYSVINEKDKILQYRLLVIRSGVRLEALGIKKRGKSCTAIAKEMLGYPRNTKREEILQALDALINTFKEIKTRKLNAGSYELTIKSAKWIVNCHARGWWVGYCGDRVLDPMPTLRDVKEYLASE